MIRKLKEINFEQVRTLPNYDPALHVAGYFDGEMDDYSQSSIDVSTRELFPAATFCGTCHVRDRRRIGKGILDFHVDNCSKRYEFRVVACVRGEGPLQFIRQSPYASTSYTVAAYYLKVGDVVLWTREMETMWSHGGWCGDRDSLVIRFNEA